MSEALWHVVKERGIAPEFGRAFSVAFDMRTMADYEAANVDAAAAREIVAAAEAFLDALEPLLSGAREV